MPGESFEELKKKCDAIMVVVNEQAEDEGLWFKAETAPEAYLMEALKRLHGLIETSLPSFEGKPDLQQAKDTILAEFRVENAMKIIEELGLAAFSKELQRRANRAIKLLLYYNVLLDMLEEEKEKSGG